MVTVFSMIKALFTDKRGEDMCETSSGVSNGAKVLAACTAAAGLAGGVTAATNNVNGQQDAVHKKLCDGVGAQCEQAAKQTPSIK